MTVEDYHAGFEASFVNFVVSEGGWFEDHYLFLNDEDRRNGTSGSCDECTRHEFKLTNNSTEAQKVYAQIHTWGFRNYAYNDSDCFYWWDYFKFNLPGTEESEPTAFEGNIQIIHQMQPGEELTGYVELDWTHSQASQARDWAISTYAKSGKVDITLTDMPDRPSDTKVGYYFGVSTD